MLEPVTQTPTVLERAPGLGNVAVNRSLRAYKDLPGPRGLPLIGNLLQLDIARAHTTLQRWADEFGPIYRFGIGHRDVVVISDTELVNEVLRDRPEAFRRRKLIRESMLELGIDGVFSAEGLDWRRQRKLAMHALNTSHLRDFFGRLDAVTARLHRRWDRAATSGERIDPQRDLMRFTVDVTTGLVLGTDLNTLEQQGDTIQRHLDKIFPALARRLLSPIRYWHWFKLPADRELDAAMVEVNKLVNELVTAARERVARNTNAQTKPANLLDAMVAAQSDDAAAFSNAEIVGNTLTMLLAGEDTTANTLAWMMDLLAKHCTVQAKMQIEADRVLGDARRAPDYASTGSLHYIEAVAQEAMRLKPVAPFLALEPNDDVVIGDVRVPRGTAVYVLTAHPAMSASNFADPSVFRPERWLDAGGRAGEGHNTRAFLPFGAGPRFCPGRHLAMLEIKMVGAMLCRNFDVTHAPGSPPAEELFAFTMMPKNLFVTLQRR
ncbi:MAG: cytochrome P450 [Mycetocola sp.]